MHAWWSASASDLVRSDPAAIVAALAVRLVETHPLNLATQLQAWRTAIDILQGALDGLPGDWRVLLEYPLLRLQRRIDAVLLSDRAILVLEFKVGATAFTNADRRQVEDYALDLVDFHADSRAHPIVPILVATEARPTATAWPLLWHGVAPVLDASAATLPALLHDLAVRLPRPAHRWTQAVGGSAVPPGAHHRRGGAHALQPATAWTRSPQPAPTPAT